MITLEHTIGGWSYSPCQRTFSNVWFLWLGRGYYWHLVSGSQEYHSIPYKTHDSKNLPKPCARYMHAQDWAQLLNMVSFQLKKKQSLFFGDWLQTSFWYLEGFVYRNQLMVFSAGIVFLNLGRWMFKWVFQIRIVKYIDPICVLKSHCALNRTQFLCK